MTGAQEAGLCPPTANHPNGEPWVTKLVRTSLTAVDMPFIPGMPCVLTMKGDGETAMRAVVSYLLAIALSHAKCGVLVNASVT